MSDDYSCRFVVELAKKAPKAIANSPLVIHMQWIRIEKLIFRSRPFVFNGIYGMDGYIAYLKTFIVENDLEIYFELPANVAFHKLQDERRMLWCMTYITARKTNSNLSKDEVMRILHFYIRMRFDATIGMRNESIKMFNEHSRAVNNSKIHNIWKEWEMDRLEFTSVIQWLPNEMLEDVVGMTSQSAHPRTYNHFVSI